MSKNNLLSNEKLFSFESRDSLSLFIEKIVFCPHNENFFIEANEHCSQNAVSVRISIGNSFLSPYKELRFLEDRIERYYKEACNGTTNH